MIIKIQNKPNSVSVGIGMSKRNILNHEAELLRGETDDICEMASRILDKHPRFKEIIINTELTGG